MRLFTGATLSENENRIRLLPAGNQRPKRAGNRGQSRLRRRAVFFQAVQKNDATVTEKLSGGKTAT